MLTRSNTPLGHRQTVLIWGSVLSSVTLAPSIAQANPSFANRIHYVPFSAEALPEPSLIWSTSSPAIAQTATSPTGSSSVEPHIITEGQRANAKEAEDSQSQLLPVPNPLSSPPVPPNPSSLPPDPEMGTLQLQPVPDPELGVLRLRDLTGDPELGELRLREQQPIAQPVAPKRSPSVYLLGGMNYFRSDNIFSSQVDPVDDSLFIPGLSLYARPQLGEDTYLIASVGGYLIRYVDFPEVDYNELRFRLGIRQILSPQMYGEISWTNTQLFDREEGDRFLDDHALRLLLVRSDALTPDLSLDSFYQFRANIANPSDRSRVSNSLGVALVYDITPDWEAALDYQVTWTAFTEQDRDDLYNELVAEVRYDMSPTTQINLYGGFSFGESSRSDIDFNSGILGIGVNFAVPLF